MIVRLSNAETPNGQAIPKDLRLEPLSPIRLGATDRDDDAEDCTQIEHLPSAQWTGQFSTACIRLFSGLGSSESDLIDLEPSAELRFPSV